MIMDSQWIHSTWTIQEPWLCLAFFHKTPMSQKCSLRNASRRQSSQPYWRLLLFSPSSLVLNGDRRNTKEKVRIKWNTWLFRKASWHYCFPSCNRGCSWGSRGLCQNKWRANKISKYHPLFVLVLLYIVVFLFFFLGYILLFCFISLLGRNFDWNTGVRQQVLVTQRQYSLLHS